MSAFEMTHMPSDMHMGPASWTRGYALLMFFMWWIMMVAMMLPSASPAILLVMALNRKAHPDRQPYGASGCFAGGYLVAWAGFSLVAVAAQWGLTESDLLSSALRITTPALAGGLLIAAGLWQLTPIKRACLRHCRSPVRLLTRHPPKGDAGSFVLGMRHGAYCLGCCWFLMALLFVGGIMNLYWITGLALYVLAEKVLPGGERIRQLAGAGLVLWGLALAGGLG